MEVTCCSYWNPCDTSFSQYEFNNLSCCSKATTVFFTVLGCVLFSLPIYRLCLKNLSQVEDPKQKLARLSQGDSFLARTPRKMENSKGQPLKQGASGKRLTKNMSQRLSQSENLERPQSSLGKAQVLSVKKANLAKQPSRLKQEAAFERQEPQVGLDPASGSSELAQNESGEERDEPQPKLTISIEQTVQFPSNIRMISSPPQSQIVLTPSTGKSLANPDAEKFASPTVTGSGKSSSRTPQSDLSIEGEIATDRVQKEYLKSDHLAQASKEQHQAQDALPGLVEVEDPIS